MTRWYFRERYDVYCPKENNDTFLIEDLKQEKEEVESK